MSYLIEKVLPCGHKINIIAFEHGLRVSVSTKTHRGLGITVSESGTDSVADIFVARESLPALKEIIDTCLPQPSFLERLKNLF